jgi:uncharacterized protein (DUF3820 family)
MNPAASVSVWVVRRGMEEGRVGDMIKLIFKIEVKGFNGEEKGSNE